MNVRTKEEIQNTNLTDLTTYGPSNAVAKMNVALKQAVAGLSGTVATIANFASIFNYPVLVNQTIGKDFKDSKGNQGGATTYVEVHEALSTLFLEVIAKEMGLIQICFEKVVDKVLSLPLYQNGDIAITVSVADGNFSEQGAVDTARMALAEWYNTSMNDTRYLSPRVISDLIDDYATHNILWLTKGAS